ncbi:MAG: ribonuclease Z [Candidatus Altiarchaeota archaeon]|nr:ribonuclease Z [Candidatus Altiarchaeota archaeon]
MIELTFLGTNATKPTLERFTSSIAIRHEGEVYLFDCGEGIQIRIGQSGFSLMKIDKLFVTHLHGDHVLGIPGILFSMAKNQREAPLKIYGPPGTAMSVHHMRRASYGRIPFEIDVIELEPGDTVGPITAFETEHTGNSIGYVFREPDTTRIDKAKMDKHGFKPNSKFKKLKQGETIEINGIKLKPKDWLIPVKGSSLAYTGDTVKSDKVIEAVAGVDLLIHESTYLSEDDSGFDYGHCSAKDAARVAKQAGVGSLFLIHFSPRYANLAPLLKEAKQVFKNSFIAKDLARVTIKDTIVQVE